MFLILKFSNIYSTTVMLLNSRILKDAMVKSIDGHMQRHERWLREQDISEKVYALVSSMFPLSFPNNEHFSYTKPIGLERIYISDDKTTGGAVIITPDIRTVQVNRKDCREKALQIAEGMEKILGSEVTLDENYPH